VRGRLNVGQLAAQTVEGKKRALRVQIGELIKAEVELLRDEGGEGLGRCMESSKDVANEAGVGRKLVEVTQSVTVGFERGGP